MLEIIIRCDRCGTEFVPIDIVVVGNSRIYVNLSSCEGCKKDKRDDKEDVGFYY